MPETAPEQQSEAPTERGAISLEQAYTDMRAGRESAAAPTPGTTQADAGGPETSDPGSADSSDGSVEQAQPADEQTPDDSSGEDAAETKDPAVYRLEIDGEERDLTADELHEAVMLKADYTRKTQTLAEERRFVEQAAQQIQAKDAQLAAQAAQYEERARQVDTYLGALASVVNAEDAKFANVDWQKLKSEDRFAFDDLWADYQLHREKKQLVQVEQDRRAEEQQKFIEHDFARRKEAVRQHVQAAYPQWQDGQLRERDWSQMNKTAMSLGFQPHEISATTDTRVIDLIYKAAQFDHLVATKAGAQAGASKPGMKRLPASEPIRIIRPSAPRPSARTERATKVASLSRTLDRTGSLEDALNLFRAREQNATRR